MTVDFEALERKLQECSGVMRLDNGITIIYEDIPGFELVQAEIEIRAGSHHEPEEDQGVMHFLEHMTFNGSKRYPNIQDREERASLLGLIKNAETGSHSINFGVRGRSGYLLEENFEESFGIVSDLVFNPLLVEQCIEKERAIIQAERKELEQKKKTDPTYTLRDFIRRRLCTNNPLHLREGIGTQRSIDVISAETLKRYHDQHFVGSNTIVSLVGNVNANSCILSNVVSCVERIPKGSYAGLVEPRQEIPYNGREFVHIPSSPESSCALVQIYFQLPDPNQDAYATLMLAEVLGGSSRGLLLQDLRERKGLVYSVSCSKEEGHEKTGFLTISYYADVSRINDSLAAIDTCLEAVKRGQFSDTLVDAAKATYSPEILMSLKQPGWAQKERMFRLKAQMYEYDETGFDMRKAFSMTKTDVVRAANQYLGENRLVVVVSP